MNLRHALCGHEVCIAVLRDDVAIYVWCDHCNDIVEEGDLLPVDFDERRVRLRVDRERIRPWVEMEES